MFVRSGKRFDLKTIIQDELLMTERVYFSPYWVTETLFQIDLVYIANRFHEITLSNSMRFFFSCRNLLISQLKFRQLQLTIDLNSIIKFLSFCS